MTDIQKEILIEKMINCPTDLTDEELMLILSDEELKDIYETSRILKTSLAKPPETDPRKEWELYRPRIARRPNMFGWIARIAAVIFRCRTDRQDCWLFNRLAFDPRCDNDRHYCHDNHSKS